MGLFDERIARPSGYYVYVHYNNDVPIYVGMGSNGRVLVDQRRTKYDWDSYRLLSIGMEKDEARELEGLIQEELKDVLVNKMINGKHSEDTKKKQRAQWWNHSEETKIKMRKPKSDEHKLALKKAWIKRKQNGII